MAMRAYRLPRETPFARCCMKREKDIKPSAGSEPHLPDVREGTRPTGGHRRGARPAASGYWLGRDSRLVDELAILDGQGYGVFAGVAVLVQRDRPGHGLVAARLGERIPDGVGVEGAGPLDAVDDQHVGIITEGGKGTRLLAKLLLEGLDKRQRGRAEFRLGVVVRAEDEALRRVTADLDQLWGFPGVGAHDVALKAQLAGLLGNQPAVAEVARRVDGVRVRLHNGGKLRGEVLIARLVGCEGDDTIRATR